MHTGDEQDGIDEKLASLGFDENDKRDNAAGRANQERFADRVTRESRPAETSGAPNDRGAKIAFGLATVAALAGIIFAIVLGTGLTSLPFYDGDGAPPTDFDNARRGMYGWLMASYLLWSALGVIALVMAMLAIRHRNGVGWAKWALAIAALAPIVSASTFLTCFALTLH